MKKLLKWGGIAFVVLIIIGALAGSGDNNGATDQSATPSPAPSSETMGSDDNAPSLPATTNETVAQKNAVRKAQSYLDFAGFSRDGLVKQLEFDKFSHEDAVYGADNVGADWNKQAEIKAKSYLDFSAFSRDSLIAQLEFDGFTNEQAIYGVDAVGL